ncbi:Transposon resolvase, partial [mine drainage metagenome]
MLAALAEFERELILERTRAGIARARALGKKFGAPRRIPESVAREVRTRRDRGESLRMISQRMNLKLGAVRSVLARDRTSQTSGALTASSPAATGKNMGSGASIASPRSSQR